jgi:hypothetical protein
VVCHLSSIKCVCGKDTERVEVDDARLAARTCGHLGRPRPSLLPDHTDQPTTSAVRTATSVVWHKPPLGGRAEHVCPGISDINLFRYCQGVIHFDARISDRAFDPGMTGQQLDGPQVACPPIDQGCFCSSQRMGLSNSLGSSPTALRCPKPNQQLKFASVQ